MRCRNRCFIIMIIIIVIFVVITECYSMVLLFPGVQLLPVCLYTLLDAAEWLLSRGMPFCQMFRPFYYQLCLS